jgi:hypothetical protein
MRTEVYQLNGKPFEVAAVFGAGSEIQAKLGLDPVQISREAMLEAHAAYEGREYIVKFNPTMADVALLLWIGQHHAGGGRTLKEVQELVFEHGFLDPTGQMKGAKDLALSYVALFVLPKTQLTDLPFMDGTGEAHSGE